MKRIEAIIRPSKLEEINYTNGKEDVITFINDKDSLDLWSPEFSIEISKKLE